MPIGLCSPPICRLGLRSWGCHTLHAPPPPPRRHAFKVMVLVSWTMISVLSSLIQIHMRPNFVMATHETWFISTTFTSTGQQYGHNTIENTNHNMICEKNNRNVTSNIKRFVVEHDKNVLRMVPSTETRSLQQGTDSYTMCCSSGWKILPYSSQDDSLIGQLVEHVQFRQKMLLSKYGFLWNWGISDTFSNDRFSTRVFLNRQIPTTDSQYDFFSNDIFSISNDKFSTDKFSTRHFPNQTYSQSTISQPDNFSIYFY